MSLSTHVLDASTGNPAVGVAVRLERPDGDGDGWLSLAEARTDGDGRVGNLADPDSGRYRIRFDSGEYFAVSGIDTFYPEVVVVFEIVDRDRHTHVPLLLSPFAYSTYRGS